ncbi:T-cell surface glycoprotein CD3 epsilon chain [Apteryx rowi]|uniref:T-cell surface glycoprotein CD3 epsilon chain n=1 Tax=Apteryx rowi TaxID=308060 RepID=UPI000E1DC3FE|nr:T-cell surface glycoprotein CD3 epsilon chain [Apteryx rowi]
MAEKSRRMRNTRMRFELSLLLLGLLLCVVGTAAQEEGAEAGEGSTSPPKFLVDISGTTVTITCPVTEGDIVWKSTLTKPTDNVNKYVIENYDNSPGNVSCSSGQQKYNMYLKARVCANCEELDALAVTGIITADLLITLGVLILVYYFSKDRKGKASSGAGSRPRGQKMQHPPPVPNPDYEPIRKGQREVYAGLEPRGF